MDELKISWNDNTCRLIHKKCHKKSYDFDINYHMTQNKIVTSVARSGFLGFLGCELGSPASFLDPQLIHKYPLQLLHKNVICVNQ